MRGADLPEVLRYRGEFGAELVLFLPFVTWLSKAGLLVDRVIETYMGMACFYEDLDVREVRETSELRRYVAPKHRLHCMPVKDEHDFRAGQVAPYMAFPDLRRKFLDRRDLQGVLDGLLGPSEKKLLIIHNKFATEWKCAPINFINIETLKELFSILCDNFQVVYVRHRGGVVAHGYSPDASNMLAFGDTDMAALAPGVLDFEEIYQRALSAGFVHGINFFKNLLYARCYNFISVQGGGAHHCALFSGSTLSILHKRGAEVHGVYQDGYYGFAANPPPVRLICQTDRQLLAAGALMARSRIFSGRTFLSPSDLVLFPGAIH